VGAGRVWPVRDEALANTSYLVDLGHGDALVVDPRRDIETYQRLAETEACAGRRSGDPSARRRHLRRAGLAVAGVRVTRRRRRRPPVRTTPASETETSCAWAR
jgi:hypothetical protein